MSNISTNWSSSCLCVTFNICGGVFLFSQGETNLVGTAPRCKHNKMALSSKQSQADDKQDEEVKYITSIDDDKSATKNNKIFTGLC